MEHYVQHLMIAMNSFAQRIYSDTVLEDFEEINGYDITDYTPALLMPGKDQIASFLCWR